MPVRISKADGGYRVSTPGGVKAKHASKENAEAQKRLLQAVEHEFKPTGKRRKSTHNPGHVPGHIPFGSMGDMKRFHPQTMEEFRKMMGD